MINFSDYEYFNDVDITYSGFIQRIKFTKFKASILNIDEHFYKEAKINVQKLIKIKRRLLPRKTKGKCWLTQGAMESP